MDARPGSGVRFPTRRRRLVLGALILAGCLLLGFAGLQAGWRRVSTHSLTPSLASAPVLLPPATKPLATMSPASSESLAPLGEPDTSMTLYLPVVAVGAPLGEVALASPPLVLPDPRSDIPPSLARRKPAVPLSVRPQAAEAVSAGAPAGDSRWIWPVRGEISLSYSDSHRAIDIVADHGTLVAAADGGEVVYAEWEISGYGYLVIVDHGDGYRTYYGHLYGFYVDVGQQLARGDLVGQLGTTGHSTGPHVHFEIRYQGIHLNPLDLLPTDRPASTGTSEPGG